MTTYRNGKYSDTRMEQMHHANLAGERIKDLAREFGMDPSTASNKLSQWRKRRGLK